jgi:hypothetical protein
MGLKNIYLLGIDQQIVGTRTHFWTYWPPHKQPKAQPWFMTPYEQQEKVFDINVLAYTALREFALHKGATILNCNPDSKLDVFDKIPFGDVVEQLKAI